jgi:hypothetical protein
MEHARSNYLLRVIMLKERERNEALRVDEVHNNNQENRDQCDRIRQELVQQMQCDVNREMMFPSATKFADVIKNDSPAIIAAILSFVPEEYACSVRKCLPDSVSGDSGFCSAKNMKSELIVWLKAKLQNEFFKKSSNSIFNEDTH